MPPKEYFVRCMTPTMLHALLEALIKCRQFSKHLTLETIGSITRQYSASNLASIRINWTSHDWGHADQEYYQNEYSGIQEMSYEDAWTDISVHSPVSIGPCPSVFTCKDCTTCNLGDTAFAYDNECAERNCGPRRPGDTYPGWMQRSCVCCGTGSCSGCEFTSHWTTILPHSAMVKPEGVPQQPATITPGIVVPVNMGVLLLL